MFCLSKISMKQEKMKLQENLEKLNGMGDRKFIKEKKNHYICHNSIH